MSQFAKLIITDEDTVRCACRGWVPPADEPVTKNLTNPFTGEPVVFRSYVPTGIENVTNCASLDEVHEQLKNAKPLSFDFQTFSFFDDQFLNAAKSFLYGNGEEGPVPIKRIPPDVEPKVVEYLGNQMGPYANETTRRDQNLSMFVLDYGY